MLKIYTDVSHYSSSKRGYLSDILRPFVPIHRLEKFGIKKGMVKLVQHIEECDLCILPMAWNYYIKTHTISVADKMIKEAQKNGKYILIGVYGDYFIALPNYEHIIGMYTSIYKSLFKSNYISLPVIIRDPLLSNKLEKVTLREINAMPSIGFCGQSDPNLIVSSMKMAQLIWKNVKYNCHLSKCYPGPVIPPTYLRKKVLDILDATDTLHTEFLRRDRYQGGKSKKMDSFKELRNEFYHNIENTDYTLCIRGTGNFSARFYETLALGRIPIFINTDCILPFADAINWKKHVIWIEQNEIPENRTKILDFHKGLTPKLFTGIQIKNRQLWEDYFSFPGFIDKLIIYLKETMN